MWAEQPKPAKVVLILLSLLAVVLLGRIVCEILALHPTTISPHRESTQNAFKFANFAHSSNLIFHVFYVFQQ